jgi:predicted TIM-barrel fold metal-dependent hydrolase
MRPPHRRQVLAGSVAAALAPALRPHPTAAAPPDLDAALRPRGGVVDANVWLGRWPFRRLRGDDPDGLVDLLRAHGIIEAWAGSLEGPFHDDLAAANARLAKACRAVREMSLVPFGTINPTLPDWEEDLRQVHEAHRMPGLRLHPNYHGYALDDPALGRLIDAATRRGLVVGIVATLEDPRHQSRHASAPDVDLAPLPALLARHPDARVLLLNGLRRPADPAVAKALATGRLWLDVATLDTLDGLAGLLATAPAWRVLFGSFAPVYYVASSLLKLPESALDADATAGLLRRNASTLLSGAARP